MDRDRRPAPRGGGFRIAGYWVWCGSVVKGEDGRYHMFASRWPKTLPMHPGWLVASEVVRAVSETPEGPYRFEEVVLPARGAEYWDGRSTHNPHIVKHGDLYLLYYMGSTHPFKDVSHDETYDLHDPRCIVARANKRIGLAVASSVFGPWERMDTPILQPRPDKFDNFFTSNPAPCVHEDGSVLLVYKTRTYKSRPYTEFLHGDTMSFGVARASHYRGPYMAVTDETIFPQEKFCLEDPFIYRVDGGYEMIAKDMIGNICGEYHGGMLARSADGVVWEAEEGRKAYSRTVLWDDGAEQIMGSLERPFVLFEDGAPTHLFFATADGPGEFTQAANTWNMVIPLGQG
ncbi:glycoside hydrolase family protein [Paenibacillus ferrarius]|uniref:glycoside hydrolase family protein n=1 Tax=Paenibacillus ferrarius TaxID=1469647 RepID=UPI003D27FB79